MTGAVTTGQTMVIGIGNDYRRDDGVGPVVARRVASRLEGAGRHDVEVLDGVPDPLDLLGRWDGAALVVVIDAVRSPAPVGTVAVVDLAGAPSAAGATSTHGFGVAAALRLARALGQAPGRVVAVTVAGEDFARGTDLGPAVAGAVPEAVERVLALIAPSSLPPGGHDRLGP
jgi:hydrogenase maturation protease